MNWRVRQSPVARSPHNELTASRPSIGRESVLLFHVLPNFSHSKNTSAIASFLPCFVSHAFYMRQGNGRGGVIFHSVRANFAPPPPLSPESYCFPLLPSTLTFTRKRSGALPPVPPFQAFFDTSCLHRWLAPTPLPFKMCSSFTDHLHRQTNINPLKMNTPEPRAPFPGAAAKARALFQGLLRNSGQ